MNDYGTRNTSTPCNGSQKIHGIVTIDEMYAASLDQMASKIFCAILADKGHTVIGVDASNIFAEAPAPKAPLFMDLDCQFHS